MPAPPSRAPARLNASVGAAIREGLFPRVRYLLELGLSASAPDPDDLHGRSPLALCSLIADQRWAVSLARLLLEKGASVAQVDRAGLNALHYACAHAREELASVLLGATDFDLNSGDRHGNTALLYAAGTGSLPLVGLLLDSLRRFGLPLDRANRLGVTPLMQAWRQGHLAAGRLLLTAGADPGRSDAAGRTCRSYEAAARASQERQEAGAEAKRLARTLRVDDAAGWRRWRRLRARSAPGAVRGSWQEVARERAVALCVAGPPEEEPIRIDPRADLGRPFPADPAELFDRRRPERPRTAAVASHALLSNGQESENGASGRASWRGEVPRLYRQFECQCSTSYREGARPPSPPLSPGASDVGDTGMATLGLGVDNLRELYSPSRSRRGSVMSQRSTASRAKARKGSAHRQSMESVLEGDDLHALAKSAAAHKGRKRLSIDTGARTVPRPIARPPTLPE